jgi:urea carboxylase-associated protein 2
MNVTNNEKRAAIEANRKRYEDLRAEGQGATARALPPPTPLDHKLAEGAILHREIVPGGWYWTVGVARGQGLRIINPEGSSSVAMIAWNSSDRSERINYSDTVKVQWSAALRKGRMILTDMGRVAWSIIEDTSGAHDTLVGGSTAASNRAAYGEGAERNTRDNFIRAAAKLGLDRRDIPPCITFFAPVGVGEEGHFMWDRGKRRAGDFVDLRAEINLVVALSNCPHPLDPASAYAPAPVEVVLFRAAPPGPDDPCRTAGAEARRAFEFTDRLFTS